MSLKSVLLNRNDLGLDLVVADLEASPRNISLINEKKKKRRLKMSFHTSIRFLSFSNQWYSKRIKKFKLVRMYGLPSKLRPCSSLYSPTGVSFLSDLSITYTSELSLTCYSASLTA